MTGMVAAVGAIVFVLAAGIALIWREHRRWVLLRRIVKMRQSQQPLAAKRPAPARGGHAKLTATGGRRRDGPLVKGREYANSSATDE